MDPVAGRRASTQDRFKGRRTLRVVLYAMLMMSAAAVFFGGNHLWAAARTGALPVWAPLVAPGAFTGFVVLYGVDRWLLVRRNRYPITRATFQLTFALLFLTLLWPEQAAKLRQVHITKRGDAAMRLLGSAQADMRALACEVLGYRGPASTAAELRALAEGDTSPVVRDACRAALARLGDPMREAIPADSRVDPPRFGDLPRSPQRFPQRFPR